MQWLAAGICMLVLTGCQLAPHIIPIMKAEKQARVHTQAGEYDEAIQKYQEAMERYKQANSQSGIASTHVSMSAMYMHMGDYDAASAELDRAHEIANNMQQADVGDGKSKGAVIKMFKGGMSRTSGKQIEARVLLNQGSIHSILGRYPQALEVYHESLVLRREDGKPELIANALLNIGLAYTALGDYRKAFQHFDEARRLFKKKVKNLKNEAGLYGGYGNLYSSIGNLDEAEKQYTHALQLTREAGYRPRESVALAELGAIYTTRGDFDKARESYEQAMQAGDGGPWAERAAVFIGDLEAITGNLESAKRIYTEHKETARRGYVHLLQKEYRAAQKDFQTALKDPKQNSDSDRRLMLYSGH